MIENLIMKRPGESAIVTLTKKRIRLNLNMFCMFTGKLGSGKSWSAISFAQELDPEFDIDRQVVFDFRKCMELINSDWLKTKKMKIIVWDEPQITISNRAWQSQVNRLVNYLISTFRHQNIILIMAAPYKDFLDSQTMKLLTWEFQCTKVNKRKKICVVRPKYQQYNPQVKKTYPHPLYILVKHKKKKMVTWNVKIPKDIEIYEKNKTDFTTGLNKTIQDTLDKLDKVEDVVVEVKPKKPLTELQEEILVCWKEGKKQKDIVLELGRSQKIISESEKYMRNKGYDRVNCQNDLL